MSGRVAAIRKPNFQTHMQFVTSSHIAEHKPIKPGFGEYFEHAVDGPLSLTVLVLFNAAAFQYQLTLRTFISILLPCSSRSALLPTETAVSTYRKIKKEDLLT